MSEICSISIVGFGVLAIALHLIALLKPRRPHRRLPIRYLPPAPPLVTFPRATSHNTLTQGSRR